MEAIATKDAPPAAEKDPVRIAEQAVKGAMARLIQLSVDRHYNPYVDFKWPDELPFDQYWMGPELLTVYGTEHAAAMSEEQLMRLSRWESINFYSLSMFGERDLAEVVLQHIHYPAYRNESEYFHHFIEEENKHMWFFSQFCLRYGGKFYEQKAVKYSSAADPEMKSYVNFAKIMIFEEIGNFYNIRIRDDERVPPFIRYLNRVHHQDESRHIAMGRELLKLLHRKLVKRCSAETLAEIEQYLKRYMRSSIESLYCPAVYVDAGLADPYKLRNALLTDPVRERFHKQVLSHTMNFFVGSGLFLKEGF
jgi:para-aminobenzoate N-oxygenase AurF